MITEQEKEALKKCVDLAINSTSTSIMKIQDPEQSLQARETLKYYINLSEKVDTFPVTKPDKKDKT